MDFSEMLSSFSSASKNKSDDVLNPTRFSISVEKLVVELDLSYLDSIVQCAEFYEIEMQNVAKLLTPHVMEKLKNESIKAKLVRDDSTIDALI